MAVLTCPRCSRENADDARFCQACGAPLVTEAAAGAEERKTVTIVFVHLVGFTAQAERLDPEDVRRVLAPYHARLRSELERHGGAGGKVLRGAGMAGFRPPAAHEGDPERGGGAARAGRGR